MSVAVLGGRGWERLTAANSICNRPPALFFGLQSLFILLDILEGLFPLGLPLFLSLLCVSTCNMNERARFVVFVLVNYF